MPTADATSPIRDCHHPRARHIHGTRSAYVADRCRCDACRAANRTAGRARSRAIAYGGWNPFVDAIAVRAHVERLRAAGLGVDRLVMLSGVPSGTLRSLLYGDPRTGSPVRRVRHATAAKLLSLNIASADLALHALADGTDTHRRLRDLTEAGWSIRALAAELDRATSSLRATLQSERVTVETSLSVRALHRRALGSDDQPPASSHADESVDDGATNPPPDEADDVAVQRAMRGEPVDLNDTERDLAVRRLSDQGVPARRIAVLLGISARTVARRRARGAN